jgi:hypothetical protein
MSVNQLPTTTGATAGVAMLARLDFANDALTQFERRFGSAWALQRTGASTRLKCSNVRKELRIGDKEVD